MNQRMIQEAVEGEDDEASECGLEDVQVDAGQQRLPYNQKKIGIRPWVSHDRRLLYGH